MRERLYCNTCQRFVNKEDIRKSAENIVIHRDHKLIWVNTPDSCDKFDNDELNAKFSEVRT